MSTEASQPSVLMPASSEDRLAKIAEMHFQGQVGGGMTTGECHECGWSWPCPTYRWATEQGVGVSCTWDLRDCEFEDHAKHEKSST